MGSFEKGQSFLDEEAQRIHDERAASEKWDAPEPLPCMLLPVEKFNEALLPLSLRPWVCDIAERMQCPPDFPAVGAMVALSAVIGRKACIRPKRHDDWSVVPNLWGAIVGRPGVMKSPPLAEVLKPLERLQSIASDLHREATVDHEVKAKLDAMSAKSVDQKAQKLVAEGKIEAARDLMSSASSSQSDNPPALRRYRVNDTSVEALGEILIDNPNGVLVYRDELHGLLRSLDKEGQEGSRAFYLQAYDANQSYTFDRIGRGKNLHIDAVCLSVLGGIQPGKLESYVRDAVGGGSGDDGLLQRFGMIVWPDVDPVWRNVDRYPNTAAKQQANAVFDRIDATQPNVDPETEKPAPAVYRFTSEAQIAFDAWRFEFETGLRSGAHHPAMESHLAKFRKLVPAIALLCAVADGETEVSMTSLTRALSWSEYLQSHAARVYGAGTGPQTEAAKALLDKIKQGKLIDKEGKPVDQFKAADVYLKGWSVLNTPETVRQAAAVLCDLGHLRKLETRPTVVGGRPSLTYLINPASMPEDAV